MKEQETTAEVTSGGLQRIRAFVADYHVDDGRRPATPAEKRLIAAALIDYLLVEPSGTRLARHQIAPALQALRDLAGQLPEVCRTQVELVELALLDLAGQLEHRDDAHLIMQEHLIILAEDLRRARTRP